MNDFDNKQICSYKDIDRFGFTCDVCGRKVNGCHYINGMKFCAKCYQETFGKDNQQNEIQQIKQQLTENIVLLEGLRKSEEEKKDIAMKRVYELKQQLAKKEKELKQLKLDLGMFKSVNEFINGYGIEKAREVLLQSEKTRNQTAITELKKLKEEFNGFFSISIQQEMFDKYIDQQIAELKGETNE